MIFSDIIDNWSRLDTFYVIFMIIAFVSIIIYGYISTNGGKHPSSGRDFIIRHTKDKYMKDILIEQREDDKINKR